MQVLGYAYQECPAYWGSWLAEWKAAWLTVTEDTVRALLSLTLFLYLSLQPIVYLLLYLVRAFLEWVYSQGVDPFVAVGRAIFAFQTSLTRQQVMIEVSVILFLYLAWRGWRYAQKRGWLLRAKLSWLRLRKSYHRSLKRIGEVSRWVAIMIPHALFAGVAIGIQFIFPSLLRYLSQHTHVRPVLSLLIPLFLTIGALSDDGNDEPMKKRSFLTPSKKQTRNHQVHQLYWIQFWTVRASLQLLKRLLPAWDTIAQLELWFYVWIYALEPLDLVAPLSIHALELIHQRVSSVVPEELWAYAVPIISPFIQLAVTLRLVSQPTADAILHAIESGRTLVLPCLVAWMPLGRFAAMYTQYVLPCCTYNDSNELKLQYWVVHAIAACIMSFLNCLLVWIPFSHFGQLLFWWYLSWPTTTRRYYAWIEADLQYFGILPRRDGHDLTESKLVRSLQWILERLPSAAEKDEPQKEDTSRKQHQHDDKSVLKESKRINRQNDDYTVRDIHPKTALEQSNHEGVATEIRSDDIIMKQDNSIGQEESTQCDYKSGEESVNDDDEDYEYDDDDHDYVPPVKSHVVAPRRSTRLRQ